MIGETRRRRPADWEPIEAVWLAWPTRPSTWPGRLKFVAEFYIAWINALTESVPVNLLVDADVPLPDELANRRDVHVHRVATDDVWIRDYGPAFVWQDGELITVGFEFDSWGGKYPPFDQDNAAAKRIAEIVGCRFESHSMVLEGGALDTDGQGRCIVNESCVLDRQRNRGADRQDIARVLHQTLGVTEIAWTDVPGIVGDDTDGHIDQVARFVSPNVVVVANGHEDAPEDVASLQTLRAQLKLWAVASDRDVAIEVLPAIRPRQIDRQVLPQSYCNFQRLGADRILMPSFGDVADDRAADQLAHLTGATVEKIDCRDLVYGLGALHCASLEQPAL